MCNVHYLGISPHVLSLFSDTPWKKTVARLRLVWTLILTEKSRYIVSSQMLILREKCGLKNNIIKYIQDLEGRFRLYIFQAS